MESFIYVIASDPEGPVKVGHSIDPEKRRRQLQTGHSSTLAVHYREAVPADLVRVMEQAIHASNRHRKIKGEWFDLSVEDAILEVRHAMIRFEDKLGFSPDHRFL